MHKPRLHFGATFLLLGALLAGCGSDPTSATAALTPDPVPGPLATTQYPYAVTLSVDAGDTATALAQLYGGKIVQFDPTEGYATLATQSKTLPTDPKSRERTQEQNQQQIRGGGLTAMVNGSRTAWATGALTTWTSGSRTAWATGEYQPIKGNTAPFKQIGLELAQRAAPHLGAGVTVAVIDSGVDLNHPALAGSLVAPGLQYDFYNDDPVPQDVDASGSPGTGHGTAVASIVLQIAPKAKIMPLRALGPDGSGDILSVARAVDWAVDKGANVINLSLGADQRSEALQRALNRARSKGVYMVLAAGNENHKGLDYPAADANLVPGGLLAVSVGSVGTTDLKSPFSNYDLGLELVAPGENIGAAYPGGALAVWSGTSMSAPIVSGALALALGEKTKSADLIYNLIKDADEVDNLKGNEPYQHMLGLNGRLNIHSFLGDVLPRQ